MDQLKYTMSEPRRLTTPISIAVAVICAAWAIYATQHRPQPGAGGPPGGQGAGAGMRNAVVAAVTVAPVRSTQLGQKLEALGNARANESVDISSKTSNIVTQVRFRDGQRVALGQVLVQLDDAQARADVAAAQAALTESESTYNRSRELVATQALSKSQFDQLEATFKANRARLGAATARLEDTVIRAPFSGRVGLRRVSVGTLISPGDVITTLDDTSVIKLDFAVPENFLASLREGLPVVATAPAFANRSFTGKVAGIDSRVDQNTRSVTVRALLANSDGVLKPGMFLNVTLARDDRATLVIPEEALSPEAEKQFVYVVSDGKVQRREVRIGGRQPGSVEVLAGVKAGEQVIVEGTQKVRDGATVRAIERVEDEPLSASEREPAFEQSSHEASASPTTLRH
jgi:membrane fusion protein (multidrug efflux system)